MCGRRRQVRTYDFGSTGSSSEDSDGDAEDVGNGNHFLFLVMEIS